MTVREWLKEARQRWLATALVVASIVAIFFSVISGYRQDQYAKCQSAVNDALVTTQSLRAEFGAQDREADRAESEATAKLIEKVFTSPNPADRLAAYRAYHSTMDAIDARRVAIERERQGHPLPAPPSKTCG